MHPVNVPGDQPLGMNRDLWIMLPGPGILGMDVHSDATLL